MTQMENIIFLTNVTTVMVYSVVFLLLFMIGYIAKSAYLYKTLVDLKKYDETLMAWYPFASLVSMSKTVKMNWIPHVISAALFFCSAIITFVIMVVKRKIITDLVAVTVLLYIIYSAIHFFLLKKFMNKFRPDVTTAYILFACAVPLFKYLIHIDFSDKKQN